MNPTELLNRREIISQMAYWDDLCQWGYPLFLAAFFILAAILLLTVLFPRQSNNPVINPYGIVRLTLQRYRGIIAVAAVADLLILTAVAQQLTIDQRRGFIADQEKHYESAMRKLVAGVGKEEALRMEYLYMPEGESLKYMSLGNTALAADYVWLTSMQYVASAFRRGHKFEMLSRFYRTALELDPHWTGLVVNGGKVLSALEPQRRLVERFYIDGIVKNPDEWLLPYEAAQLFIFPPLNPRDQKEYGQTAVAWLDTTLNRKSLPEKMKLKIEEIKARLALEAGYYETSAEILWKNAQNRENPDAIRKTAIRDWLYAHSIVQVNKLQKAIDKFKETAGRYPPTLDAILDKESRLRVDDFGYPVEYAAETGKVSSRGVALRRAVQAHLVMRNLIALYAVENENKYPADLKTLQGWVKWRYGPKNPPSSLMTDSLGPDLDVINGPLGVWEYRPESGQIIIPPDCNIKHLFRDADKLLKADDRTQQ